MLIDFHTHCFPDRIYQRAISNLQETGGGLITYSDGSLGGLRKTMSEQNVDISVVLNISTNAHQQSSVNNFAAEINNKKDIFAFGSVHPQAPDVMEELERIKELGLVGVKFHPEYQGFEADAPYMKAIYRKVSQLGLIAVFHAGVDYGFSPPYKAMPQAMAKVIDWFDTPVVAAHWGGINCNQDVIDYLCGHDVYFDLSFGYCMMPKYYAEAIAEKHGTDKLLFGTDSPWHSAELEMRLIKSLGFSDDDMAKITHLNAMKLLNI